MHVVFLASPRQVFIAHLGENGNEGRRKHWLSSGKPAPTDRPTAGGALDLWTELKLDGLD